MDGVQGFLGYLVMDLYFLTHICMASDQRLQFELMHRMYLTTYARKLPVPDPVKTTVERNSPSHSERDFGFKYLPNVDRGITMPL